MRLDSGFLSDEGDLGGKEREGRNEEVSFRLKHRTRWMQKREIEVGGERKEGRGGTEGRSKLTFSSVRSFPSFETDWFDMLKK